MKYFTLLVRNKLPTEVHQVGVIRVKEQSMTHIDGDLVMGYHVLQITLIRQCHIFHHRRVIVWFKKKRVAGTLLGPRHLGSI